MGVEHFGLDTRGSTTKSYQEVIGNLNIDNFKSSLSNKLPTQEEVDSFNKDNSNKTGKDLTIEYLQNDVEILDYCMNEYVKLSMKEFKLNALPYVSLPGYSFDCWLTSSGVTSDTLQDNYMLDDFVEAKRGGICGIMGDRYVNGNNIWYIDANNLYGYAMMQKLPYKTIEKMYNSDGDFIYVRPSTKTETKDIIKTKTKPDDNIYTRIKFECRGCHEKFRSKVALTTHSYSHNRMYLENTEDFEINSSQNMREFYFTDKGGNYIEDIDEATDYSLEEIKNCYQFRKVKSFKYKVTAESEYKKRTKEKVKITKTFFSTDFIINKAIYDYGDFKQWLDFEKEIYEGYGYVFEFFVLRSIQINIEPTKASIGSYID